MATGIDLIIIVAYLLFILWLGIRAAKNQHLEGYLVNQRKTKLLLLTLSNTATIVGAGAVVGVASSAYSTGISYGIPVLIASAGSAVLLALLSQKIKEFGDKNKAHTLGDYFFHRYGKTQRTIAAILIVLTALMWSSTQFAAIAQLVHTLLGINFTIAIAAAALITIIYTSLAGLKSDLLTDFWQFWIMTITFIILIPIAWAKAGGITALQQLPASYYNPLSFGGVAFLVGGVILGGLINVANVNYWQRIYSADSLTTAKKSFWYAVPLISIFVTASVIAGLFATILLPGIQADNALFSLMNNLLPTGILGLAYAGIMAVAMSSVDSSLLGGSATIIKDIYLPLTNKQIAEHKLLNLTRYVTALFGIIGATIALIFPNIVQLSIFAASCAILLVPPAIAGIYWKRATSTAATSASIISVATLFILTPIIPKIAFIPAFAINIIVLVITSLLAKPRQI